MTGTVVYDVRRASGEQEMQALLELRREVFCREQGVPEREETDGRDGDATHLVAVSNGQVIGTCRLLLVGSTAQFSRLAVSGHARRRGVAAALLCAAESDARAAGGRRLVLHAQTYARALYDGAGYRTRGRVFVEAGIEHIAMQKAIV